MFTGIVEATGKVSDIKVEGTNRHIRIESPFSHELKVDQSVSHNGVCLTVTRIEGSSHWVTAVRETLERSTLGRWKVDTVVNLERSMIANGRFDGHIVQGHVDQKAHVSDRRDEGGSWTFTFEYSPSAGHITVEKGSICVDGVSLTCFNSMSNSFSVAIIPYTLAHTNFGGLKVGDEVNLEFDIIGKYVRRLLGQES